jgi:hypothetical protein
MNAQQIGDRRWRMVVRTPIPQSKKSPSQNPGGEYATQQQPKPSHSQPGEPMEQAYVFLVDMSREQFSSVRLLLLVYDGMDRGVLSAYTSDVKEKRGREMSPGRQLGVLPGLACSLVPWPAFCTADMRILWWYCDT